MGADMQAGPGATAALVFVLHLASAVSQPPMDKSSTLFGARRTFLTGVVILLIGGGGGGAVMSDAGKTVGINIG